MRYAKPILAAMVCGLLILGLVASAEADPSPFFIQDGQKHPSATGAGDGTKVKVDGEAYNPEPGACVVYSTLAADSSDQEEAGLVRCNGTHVDQSAACNDTVVVEQLHVNSQGEPVANCFNHGTIVNGSYYTIKLRRDTASGNTFYPILFQSETSFPNEGESGIGQTVDLWSWAEHANHNVNTQCSDWGNGHANFSNWQHLNLGSGWAFEDSSTADKLWLPDVIPQLHCWSIGNLDGSGDFSVDK